MCYLFPCICVRKLFILKKTKKNWKLLHHFCRQLRELILLILVCIFIDCLDSYLFLVLRGLSIIILCSSQDKTPSLLSRMAWSVPLTIWNGYESNFKIMLQSIFSFTDLTNGVDIIENIASTYCPVQWGLKHDQNYH